MLYLFVQLAVCCFLTYGGVRLLTLPVPGGRSASTVAYLFLGALTVGVGLDRAVGAAPAPVQTLGVALGAIALVLPLLVATAYGRTVLAGTLSRVLFELLRFPFVLLQAGLTRGRRVR